MKSCKFPVVFLGDDMSYKIIGVIIIKFHLHVGIERLLEEVSFVPFLKHNSISFDELEIKEICV